MGAGPKCAECDALLGGGGPAWSYHGSQGPKHDDVRSCLNVAGQHLRDALDLAERAEADAASLRMALIAHVDHFGGVHSHPDDCADIANCEEHKIAALVDRALGSNGGKNHIEERDMLRAECGRLKASCAEIAEESSRHEAAAEALREALMLVTDDGANGPNEAWQAFVHEEDCTWSEGDEDDDDKCDGRYIVKKVLAALAADVGKSILREMANLQREVEAQKKRASAMLVVATGCVEAVRGTIAEGDAAALRFQREVAEWAAATFPRSDDHAKITHLKKEVAELGAHVCAEEAADCFLILLHIANAHDFDLAAAAREKFAALKTRAWGEPDADGVVEHVRDVPGERGESGGGR